MISVHRHQNLRYICDLDLDAAVTDQLDRPPRLKDRQRAEAHVVTIPTTSGTLRLFRVRGNGQPYTVTNTPDIAQALAIGTARLVIGINPSKHSA